MGGFEDQLQTIRKASDGDREAFDRLVREQEGPLRALVTAQMGEGLRSRIEVEDLLQETFLHAFRSIGQFEGSSEAAFRAWLARIASNTVAEKGRRLTAQKVDYQREVALPGDPSSDSPRGGAPSPNLASPQTSPSGNLRREERLERLLGAIEKLAPDHRQVIVLTRIEGLSVKEVAQRMGRSDKATSMLLLRAMLALREIFGDTDSLSLPRPGAAQGARGDHEL